MAHDGEDGTGNSDDRVGPITYESPGGSAEDPVDREDTRDADASVDANTNGESDEQAEETTIDDVSRVVVDPEAVLEAMTYNADPGPKIDNRHVFRIEPPFEEVMPLEPTPLEVEPDPDIETAETRSTLDAGDSYHVRPFRFVADGDGALKQYPSRRLAREELGEDADDEAIERWRAAAMEHWKSYVRENLLEQIDVYTSHGIVYVDVEYDAEF